MGREWEEKRGERERERKGESKKVSQSVRG